MRLISTLLVLFCLAIIAGRILGSNGIERKTSNSSNIVHCQESLSSYSASCSFHETCIETVFPCGPMGLTLGYAKPRCERLAVLQHSNSGCQQCIQSQAILDWVLLSEKCFQFELLILVESQHSKAFPDPPDCLQFERDALDVLLRCYLKTNSICHVMDSVVDSDFLVVLDAVAINSYYRSAVTKQFRKVVSSCSSPQSSSLAHKIAPQTERIFLCASLSSKNGPNDEGLTEALAEKLNQSSTAFVVASYDPRLVGTCRRISRPEWSVGSAEYFTVHWTLATGADKSALTRCQSAGQCIVGGTKYFVYFPFTGFTNSSCGNGLREAGESCDMFVYTGMGGYGCDTQCRATLNHECTTTQLQQSSCSMTVCGDGLRTSDEECDEGSESFVGCNPESCTIEEGYKCETPYNDTSHCTKFPSPSQIIPISTESEETPKSVLISSTEASATLPELATSPLQSINVESNAKDSLSLLPRAPVVIGVGCTTLAAIVVVISLAIFAFCHLNKGNRKGPKPDILKRHDTVKKLADHDSVAVDHPKLSRGAVNDLVFEEKKSHKVKTV